MQLIFLLLFGVPTLFITNLSSSELSLTESTENMQTAIAQGLAPQVATQQLILSSNISTETKDSDINKTFGGLSTKKVVRNQIDASKVQFFLRW